MTCFGIGDDGMHAKSGRKRGTPVHVQHHEK